MIIFIDPCPAPRQVRSDKWRPSPMVQRYRAFRDELRLKAKFQRIEVPESVRLYFNIAMPPSWSASKRAQMYAQPHQQTPDIDNLVKAFLDSLLENDAHVYRVDAIKRWAATGSIEVERLD